MSRASLAVFGLLAGGLAVSCGSSSDAPADAGPVDALPVDSAPVDAGPADASQPDTSFPKPPPYDGGGCPSTMREIPAGTFMMGSTVSLDERPVHAVTVSAFCMDATEVTVDAYAACVAAKACAPPAADPQCNAAGAGRGAHPANCVSWFDASAYCAFAGKRLPTEEEWEYAARGTDGRTYPWGNDAPVAQLCWSGVGNDVGQGNRRSTCVTASYPSGKSPFALFDMAGNVDEWTASGYSTDYAQARDESTRVFRGGDWSNSSALLMRAASRVHEIPTERNPSLGFRCSR